VGIRIEGSEGGVARRRRTTTRVGVLDPKLHRPAVREGIVPRSALLSRLRSSRHVPIVSIVAGPGFGKTSLLAQWAKVDRRPFAWVSVDERDNDPEVLLNYLTAALDRIEPIDAASLDAPALQGASIDDTSIPRLGNALATMRRPFVLALDDVHLLDNPECRLAIAALARRIPAGSQLAIADREEAPLPVARLRTTGDVLEIGASDLSMDEDEARALFERCGLDLGREDVARLTRRTEGWPVGLYLAALSLKDGPGVEAGVAAFAGDDRLVADYLWLEFLSRLSEDDLSFLTRTSVLERMTGALCDDVLDRFDSAERLEALERSSLFLVPLDRHREWYRYHHLFRDLLRSQLAGRDPAEGARVLRRAASWCEAHDLPDMAVGYLQAAGDQDGAARLVARLGLLPTYLGERIGTLERWLDWFEKRGLIERYPPVAVIGAFATAFAGRPATAERWADAAERGASEHATTGGGDEFDGWLALLRAFLCRDGPEQMRLDAEGALKLLPVESSWRASALYLLGLSSLLVGDVDEADDVLSDAVELAEGEGAHVLASLGWTQRGLIAVGRARWDDAERFVGYARSAVHSRHLEGHVTSALMFALRARVAAHRGDVATAELELTNAQRLRPKLTYALSLYSVQTLLELSHVHVAIADPAGARVLMREVADLLHRRPHVGALRVACADLLTRLQAIREGSPGASTLTAAELRLLPYLPTHLTFREIGDQLNVSPHTVKTQAISIYRKLAVTTRSEAVDSGRKLGLLG
jgi:LuxR family maltose regulon positive regulatory protein